MASVTQWVAGARPRTLPAAFSPVIAGTGVALWADSFVWWRALLALVVAVALQIGSNYANDYSDGIRGTDDDRVGPFRLTGSGAAAPGRVRAMAFACLGVAAVAGLSLAAATAWWLVVVGAACVLAAWFYTGGSHPYGYAGWGEAMVFVFFGLVAVMGTVYVQVRDAWDRDVLVASLLVAVGVGVLTCAILVANNLRDIPTDRVSGKLTLAVRLGDRGTRILYAALFVVALIAVLALSWATTRKVLLALAFLGLAAPAARAVLAERAAGRDLIPVLGKTGQAELVWALSVAIGLAAA